MKKKKNLQAVSGYSEWLECVCLYMDQKLAKYDVDGIHVSCRGEHSWPAIGSHRRWRRYECMSPLTYQRVHISHKIQSCWQPICEVSERAIPSHSDWPAAQTVAAMIEMHISFAAGRTTIFANSRWLYHLVEDVKQPFLFYFFNWLSVT